MIHRAVGFVLSPDPGFSVCTWERAMGVVSRRTGPPAGNPENPDSREGRGLKIKVARVNLGSRCSGGVCVWGAGEWRVWGFAAGLFPRLIQLESCSF